MDRSWTPGPSWDVDTIAANITAAAARFPARLGPADCGSSVTPEQHLRIVVSELAGSGETSAVAWWDEEPLGRALMFRLWPARVLHVVGDSLLAGEFRRLITAGAAPGWDLHPMPAGHTPLHVLAGPLHQLSGSDRFYNLLERNGFACVEEVAAMPETCWFDLRNCGTRFVTAVRQIIGELHLGDAQVTPSSLPGHDGAGPTAGGPVPPAGLPTAAAKALQVMAAWAVAEHGARTLGNSLRSPSAWRCYRRTSSAAGTASASSTSARWPGRRCPTATYPSWPGICSMRSRSAGG